MARLRNTTREGATSVRKWLQKKPRKSCSEREDPMLMKDCRELPERPSEKRRGPYALCRNQKVGFARRMLALRLLRRTNCRWDETCQYFSWGWPGWHMDERLGCVSRHLSTMQFGKEPAERPEGPSKGGAV